jgi:hypothetical protein
VLEWLALALPEAELRAGWVQEAVGALALMILDNEGAAVESGSLYHAAHGLHLYRTRAFGRPSARSATPLPPLPAAAPAVTVPRAAGLSSPAGLVVSSRRLGVPMPLFGSHASIAGGLHKAVEAAHAHGCGTVPIFTAAPQQWPVKPMPKAGTAVQSGGFLTKNQSHLTVPAAVSSPYPPLHVLLELRSHSPRRVQRRKRS